MRYCPDCGEEVTNNAAYCEACGSALDEASNESGGSQIENPGEETTHSDEEEQSRLEGINWRHAAAAVVISLIPAFGAYMMISVSTDTANGFIFFLAIPVLGYLLYRRPTTKAMFGGMFYWLSIEAFLLPVMFLLFTVVFATQETASGAEQAGAAIGGTLMMIVSFIIGIPLGIALYLVSSRLEPDEQASAAAG